MSNGISSFIVYTKHGDTVTQAIYDALEAERDALLIQRENSVRQIVREELQRSRKVGCGNFHARDGRGYCRNCGFHHSEH